MKTAQGLPQVVETHVPEMILIGEQPRTVRTLEIALVGDIDADDPHLRWPAHTGDRPGGEIGCHTGVLRLAAVGHSGSRHNQVLINIKIYRHII